MPNPIVSVRWLSEVEGIFQTSQCPIKLKTIYGASLLRGGAKSWWDSLIKTRGEEKISQMTWDELKEIFLKRFSPESEVSKLSEDFMSSKQGSQSITDFTTLFLDRAQFCPEYLASDKMLREHYNRLLRKEIRKFISVMQCESFKKLVDMARERELELQRPRENSPKMKAEYTHVPYKKHKGSSSGGYKPEKKNHLIARLVDGIIWVSVDLLPRLSLTVENSVISTKIVNLL